MNPRTIGIVAAIVVAAAAAGAIEKIVDEIIETNQNQVTAYRGGNEKLFGFFVGQVMKASKGKANPAMAAEILKARIVS